ncbi:MAG TPA: hypothetical protein DCY25_11190, partial [Bacteroidales bacterium]|nr:hypothetical protein [Bacteroidales bacterium]
MKKIVLTAILITAFIAVNVIPSQAQSPEQLYQRGLMKEEGEGSLQEAIALFNKVADNTKADQSLQAKALLHIGMCYEKLGNQEAVKAYQRLVNNYPAQKNEVSFARERLSRLVQVNDKVSETPLIPKFTKIKIPTKLSWAVKLSLDGKTLAHIADKKLWTTPLSGNVGPDLPGKPVELNTEGVEVEWTGLAWSGDGKWIAFNDIGSKDKPEPEKYNQGILVMPFAGGKPKKVIENYRDARVVNYRISLSPDGKNLAFTSVENKEQHVYTTWVEGGSPKQLVDIQAREPVFSPDAKWIAYVEDRNVGRLGGNLWIVPAAGGVPRLVARAGNASSPIWSPDGSMIAYLDYSKNKQINFIQVPVEGEETRNPISIDAPDGTEEIRLLAGWTPDNRVGALVMAKQEFSLYTLPATGGQATIVLHDCRTYQPRWSPDGQQIYYVTYPKEQGTSSVYQGFLASVSANGGSGKPVPGNPGGKVIRQLPYQSGNRISHDGKTMISSAYTSADTVGTSDWPNSKIWRISLYGGEPQQITSQPGRYADMSPSWSPDGENIAFIRAGLTDDLSIARKKSMFTVSSSGGEPEMLLPETDNYIFSPAWSPNGTMVAYITKEKEAPNISYMNVVNVENRIVRIVGKLPAAHVNIELAWSPDSKRIAFNDEKGNIIKIMNLDDGVIEDINTGLVDVNIYHLDWSPDGKQFVFGGWKGGNAEFWLMENFLPLENLAQKAVTPSARLSEDITVRQIWSGQEADDFGSASADGSLLSFTEWESGNLAVRNIKTGENRLVTDDATWLDSIQYAEYSLISHDGKQFAYTWYHKNLNYQLRLIKSDGQKPLVLYSCKGWDEYITPGVWFADAGKIIAQRSDSKTKSIQLISVNTSSGEIEVLKEIAEGYPFMANLALSPDERYLAYD